MKVMTMNNNSSIKHISFDLDGTITDSFKTIYKTTCKTLEILKINKPFPEEDFRKRIGLHFTDIFSEMNIPVKSFEEFIGIYKEHYFDFINESFLYPYVEEVLFYLNEKHIAVSLLTTKHQSQADKIIDHFGLRKYFSFVMGRRKGIANKPSAEPLLFICGQLNIEPGETMMVGDTELDIQCGKNAEAKTCGATYGYRGKGFLVKEEPDFFIQEISNLKEIVSNEA